VGPAARTDRQAGREDFEEARSGAAAVSARPAERAGASPCGTVAAAWRQA